MPTRGALPQALGQAGVTLLDEEGVEGLTLRRVASRAGVSHAAPAHYFEGLPGLRQAIATRGFQIFQSALRDATAAPAASPRARLLAVVNAYSDFAARHYGLFSLMFQEIENPSAALREAALESYGLFSECVAPLAGDRDPLVLESAIWAMAHGYGILGMSGRADRTHVAPPFEALLDLLIPCEPAAPA